MKKLQKNFKTFAVYVFLVVTTFVQLHLFVFPYGQFSNYILYFNIHFLLTNFFFLRASLMDPGYV